MPVDPTEMKRKQIVRELQATQNSGGALDLVRNDSVFDVYLEQAA